MGASLGRLYQSGEFFQGQRPTQATTIGLGVLRRQVSLNGPELQAKLYEDWEDSCARLVPWCSFPQGIRGCLSLFGAKPDVHRPFAEHVAAEYRVETQSRGRTVDEWKMRPERSDNHWLDDLVGCAVAASMQGVALSEVNVRPTAKRPRMKLSELRRRKR